MKILKQPLEVWWSKNCLRFKSLVQCIKTTEAWLKALVQYCKKKLYFQIPFSKSLNTAVHIAHLNLPAHITEDKSFVY